MLCTLTARRIKPGEFDAFQAAFQEMNDNAPGDVLERWKNVYVTRDVNDENVVLSFGLFDGTVEELREIQAAGGGEASRTSAIAGVVEEVLLDGSYEVVQHLEN
jgi:hypothetical protein